MPNKEQADEAIRLLMAIRIAAKEVTLAEKRTILRLLDVKYSAMTNAEVVWRRDRSENRPRQAAQARSHSWNFLPRLDPDPSSLAPQRARDLRGPSAFSRFSGGGKGHDQRSL